MVYYTYLWLREQDGTFPAGNPYYVGKGSGNRATTKSAHSYRPPKDKSYILVQEFPDEAAAFAAEEFLIAFYGRIDLGTGCLRNLTNGGEGASGAIRLPFSEASIQKMRIANKGRQGMLNHHHSEETKKQMSESHKGLQPCLGRTLSEETRDKIRRSHKGRKKPPLTAEHRRKLSEAAKNYWKNQTLRQAEQVSKAKTSQSVEG